MTIEELKAAEEKAWSELQEYEIERRRLAAIWQLAAVAHDAAKLAAEKSAKLAARGEK